MVWTFSASKIRADGLCWQWSGPAQLLRSDQIGCVSKGLDQEAEMYDGISSSKQLLMAAGEGQPLCITHDHKASRWSGGELRDEKEQCSERVDMHQRSAQLNMSTLMWLIVYLIHNYQVIKQSCRESQSRLLFKQVQENS